MLKKIVSLTAVLIVFLTNAFNAQTIIDFESLVVPEQGFYNGSIDHSGTIGSTETFSYQVNAANFVVCYTLENGYDYWNGFAYSNQTDLQTADWTNYSAYADPPGGANGSSNYIFAYILTTDPDSVMFDNPVNIQGFDITNTVWAYKFMTGEDGSGHTYTSDDYFILSVIGINSDGSHNEIPVSIVLGQNTEILNNWTTIDLSSLGSVKGLLFSLSTSDSWTPNYFCLDNIVYTDESDIEKNIIQNVIISPNPAVDWFSISGIEKGTISVMDITGRTIISQFEITDNTIIDIPELSKGTYIVLIQKENVSLLEKLMVK